MKKDCLEIYYTLPYSTTEAEINEYNLFLTLAGAAQKNQIPFEMVSFQSCPGRFFSDSQVYQILCREGDQALPITVFNGRIVKTSSLPSLAEFKHWYAVFEAIPFEQLQAEAEKCSNLHELRLKDCGSGCAACCADCHNPACNAS